MSRINGVIIVVGLAVAAFGAAWVVIDRPARAKLATRYQLRHRTTQFFQRATIPTPTTACRAPQLPPATSGTIRKGEAITPGAA